jgi:hypothetical protein
VYLVPDIIATELFGLYEETLGIAKERKLPSPQTQTVNEIIKG